MRTYFIFSFIIYSINSGAQVSLPNDCYSNVYLDVKLDTVYHKPDSVAKVLNPCQGFADYAWSPPYTISLKPLNSKYIILSFRIEIEAEEHIIDMPASGNVLDRRSINHISMAKMGTGIVFYCIKARHENGNIYTLKSFTFPKQ